MSPQHRPHRRLHPIAAPRSGFSLVELMAVIVIIAILVGMLLPALGGASRQAQVTKVQVEIRKLESSITNFKSVFGIDPPSSITLYEDGTASGAWGDTRSRTLIRRMWPQFQFTGAGSVRDINGDGDTTDVIQMTGAECLVFFLGGVCATNHVAADGSAPTSGTVTEWTPLGFSKNPRDPFERSQGTRVGPFMEFEPERLINKFEIAAAAHYMPELLDALPSQSSPYLYASSYDGRGYQITDLGGPAIAAAPLSLNPVTSMTNIYLQKDGVPATVGDATEVPWKQSGVQIISPGYDALYGLGGVYEAESEPYTTPRAEERDNITNFGSGELN